MYKTVRLMNSSTRLLTVNGSALRDMVEAAINAALEVANPARRSPERLAMGRPGIRCEA